MSQKRIGIYAGTFDPVHAGHIAFGLQALAGADLDMVYFLPERRPRGKAGVEHFGHRVAMLKRALQPHPKFEVLELVDISFTVTQTLPKLKKQFPSNQLVFLFGSDIVADLPAWPSAARFLRSSELVIGLRNQDEQSTLQATIDQWSVQPRALTIFPSYAPEVSSGRIRKALYRHHPAQGLLTSVERYSNQNWLYVSLA